MLRANFEQYRFFRDQLEQLNEEQIKQLGEAVGNCDQQIKLLLAQVRCLKASNKQLHYHIHCTMWRKYGGRFEDVTCEYCPSEEEKGEVL